MADITSSSHRHVRKFSKWHPVNRLCNRSSIGSAKPMIGSENQADSARLGKGQGGKEIGHNLARERPKIGHNLVRKRHKIFYA